MMVMTNLLLYTHTESTWLIALEWGVAILFLLFLFVSLFVQRRMGKRLKAELEQLDKIRKGNVEYDFILKAMKIAVWRYDAESHSLLFEKDYRDGRNNYVPAINEKFQETLSVVAPADADHVNRAFEDICEGRTDFYHQEYQVLDKASGINYWEESYATIVDRDSEGKPTKIVGTSQRIDERKELMASLVAARNKAEESDRLKTAFLANMGHEIRTPLNAIVGFADLLPVVQTEEERSQLITEIQNNNQKLLHIIDGLVSMSKIEAGAKSLLMARVDLNQLLQQMVDTYQPTTNVPITLQCAMDKLMIESDRDKLYEIVDNLIQNAVKFTTEGSIRTGYDLIDDNHVHIWVSDTGKGIAVADQQRIFERFIKLDEYIPGTGLGLSVVKSHVQSLDGKMGVKSEIGKGSTFWVDLPLA
ncbi:MAG: PAS domain-containing sensor histidine kinase [Prevotella sp.]|nr:PAS domain-containing sensor histidine kinase [Prevotella sp.]